VQAKGVSNGKCLECHQGNRAGLHATFGGKRCIDCHTQHKGRNFNIINWANVGGHDTFDHNKVGFPLSAHHGQVSCTGCHARRMKSGHISYLGLSKECDSCHRNVHNLKVPELTKNCETCHQPGAVARGRRLADWKGNHERFSHVTFDGKHNELPCAKCHEKMNLAGRSQPRGCTDCHKPIHPVKTDMTQCSTCHKVGETWKGATIDHSKVGFRLLGTHQRLGCKRCHNPPTAKLAYTDGACTNCHRKVHDGQYADKPCAACHAEGGRRTTPFSHEKDTRFPLIGFHAEPKTRANCIACHPGSSARTARAATRRNSASRTRSS
jgi:hypothetical protein